MDKAKAPQDENEERKMLKYRDNSGRIIEFPEPPEPDIVDLLDQETWGPDGEEILVPGEDDKEDDSDDEKAERPPKAVQVEAEGGKLSTPGEMLEAARNQQSKLEEEEQRKKLERVKKKEKIILERMKYEQYDAWNFPRDPDHWTEADLGEEWGDAPIDAQGSGFDPEIILPQGEEDYKTLLARERERKRVQEQEISKVIKRLKAEAKQKPKNSPKAGDREESESEEEEGFPKRPYYVPYRQNYPMIPKVHPEVENAVDTLDELEKIEEFLVWGSYIFSDGSSYEGTLWDDLAHGKGVYTTPFELCKYEGEWFQNMMQGHGVLHVNVPTYQPPPDSKLEEEMRAKGQIIKADYMSPEDREWLKKDVEDMSKIPDSVVKQPQFEDDPLWIEYYGAIPEKGRYKYAGQWKHNRMHGCGVYEVNTRLVYGKFYFGELLPEEEECTFQQCAVHAGLAEVAAGKAKMFAKKPDGMVREMEGPFSDPQHPYFYEEEDMWMAPGWVNAFYEVPDFWKSYVEDVDKEQQMWLNGFIKSPLRIPGPSELEYLWENGSEFLLLGNKPSVLGQLSGDNVDCEGEVLYHVPTGRLLNWFYDKDDNVQLFWQPYKEDGEVNPKEAEFLPDGWDEFFSDEVVKDESRKDEVNEKLNRLEEEDEKVLQELEEERKAMEQKWKEEDEEEEEKMKLLAKVEEEEAVAAAEYEKWRKEMEKAAADRAALEIEDKAKKDADGQGSKTVVTGDKANDEGDNDDDDDDEDDTKPRSFGTVAQGGFPTALASISMSCLPPWRTMSLFRGKEQRKKASPTIVPVPRVCDQDVPENRPMIISCATSSTEVVRLSTKGRRRSAEPARRCKRLVPAAAKDVTASVLAWPAGLEVLSLALPISWD